MVYPQNSDDGISSKRKQFTLFLSILCSIVASLFLIATIIFATLYGIERSKTKLYSSLHDKQFKQNISLNKTDDLCLSPYCVKAANYLLESIDESVNPCEDFYQFACGTWIKKTRIPEDSSDQDTFETMQTQVIDDIIDILAPPPSSANETLQLNSMINARKLYASCIDEEAIERENIDGVLSLINTEFGGWPILEGTTWNQSSFDLSRLLLKLNQYNRFVFFYVATYNDENNSSALCIYIGQGNLGLIDRSYYVNESEITRAYRQFMKDLAMGLTNHTSMIDSDVNDIFQFEKTISEHFRTTAERYGVRGNRTTLSNLSSLMNTSFNFTDHLRRVYRLGNVTLVNTDIITVSELKVLRNVSAIIARTSPRTIQNYLLWCLMMRQVDHMPKRFRMIKQQFNKVFQGVTKEKSRAIQCANNVNRNMGFAVSKVYIRKNFDENARDESLVMIKHIRDVFTEMINQSTWMDSTSRNVAMEKLQIINQRIGYPDGLNGDNVTDIEQRYAEYKFNSSYMQNVLILSQLNAKKNFHKLRKPVDRKEWTSILPTDVNAFYRPSFNDITFTAAILRTPFFNQHAPKYLNYGGIGFVFGHELTHGFDSIGRQFDKNGNRVPWWTNKTIDGFNQQKKCMIEQYSNYTNTQINMSINGEQTQGENIADNGGLKEAFLAYQKWMQTNRNVDKKLPGLTKYSSEQMFFLNFAQIWCLKETDQSAKNGILSNVHFPAEFRVLGPTSNLAEFDRAFGCKPGARNSRVNKCIVW